jgi:hypothetical protein
MFGIKSNKLYYIDSSILLRNKPHEMGTFAKEDIEVGTVVDYAMKIPPGSNCPAYDWKRSELCLMTNHSSEPNLTQVSRRTKNKKLIIVDYIANRYIPAGEELLVDYTKFEFSRLIDMSFLHPNAGKRYLYKQLDKEDMKLFKKIGVCSTQCKAEKYGITYFNGCSMSIPFTLFPLRDYPNMIKDIGPCVEVKIDVVKLLNVQAVYSETKAPFKWDTLFEDSFIESCKKDTPSMLLLNVYFLHKELFEKEITEYKG